MYVTAFVTGRCYNKVTEAQRDESLRMQERNSQTEMESPESRHREKPRLASCFIENRARELSEQEAEELRKE